MYYLIYIPFIIQTIVIMIDEYYFHIKRGLPRWERIGHPLDTLSVLVCLGCAIYVPFSFTALKWYAGLSILSCLMVTKDEYVHKHHCEASENWLHALLYVNHSIVLLCCGLMWWTTFPEEGSIHWLKEALLYPEEFKLFLKVQGALTLCFLFYQIIYWNFIWKKEKIKHSP